MIFGIGTDLVELSRIKKIFDRFGDHFAHKLLMAEELELFYKNKNPIRFLGMRFAAKEAIVKAMGTGFSKGIWIKDPKLTLNAANDQEKRANVEESLKLSIREVIERLCKANFPRSKREGRLSASSIQSACKVLIGYNWRTHHLIFTEDYNGHGLVRFKANYHKRTVKPEDWKDLFKDIQTACDIGFKVGGLGQRISPRGICDFPGLINSRVYTNTWYDFRTIDPSGYDWTGKDWKEDEFLPEDFHIQCQTVKQGIPVLNFNKWATSGNKTQATGGCASSRTLDNHNKGMERFAQVWNQCSTLRWKDSWEKDKKKAALTIRLGKLWPKEKEILANMEEDLRKELGAHPKKIARELQKKADALRKAKESSNLENFF